MDHFDPYNVLLAMTGFVLQGHKFGQNPML